MAVPVELNAGISTFNEFNPVIHVKVVVVWLILTRLTLTKSLGWGIHRRISWYRNSYGRRSSVFVKRIFNLVFTWRKNSRSKFHCLTELPKEPNLPTYLLIKRNDAFSKAWFLKVTLLSTHVGILVTFKNKFSNIQNRLSSNIQNNLYKNGGWGWWAHPDVCVCMYVCIHWAVARPSLEPV